jgi:6-phosphogluconolactonase
MRAYVGCRTTRERNARGEGLCVFAIDRPGGHWERIQLVGDLVNPSYLAFDRDRRRLYVVHGDFSEISAFSIEEADGRLTFLNRRSTEGRNPVHLLVDPSNRCVLVANYATGALALLPIAVDGGLDPVCDLVSLPGEPGPHRKEQPCSHPHQTLQAPDGQFVIVPDKGVDTTFVVGIDADRRKIMIDAARASRSRPGAAPRNGVFPPS